jgi:hypothetical protein
VGGPTYSPTTGGFKGGVSPQDGADLMTAGSTMAGGAKFTANGQRLGEHVFRIDPDSTVIQYVDFGSDSIGRSYSQAYAINTSRLSVGFSTRYNASGVRLSDRPVRWGPDGSATELTSLTGSETAKSVATDINDAGVIVGQSSKTAVRWNLDGSVTALGSLYTPGTLNSSSAAYLVNSGGTIAGSSTKFDAQGHDRGPRAVRWEAGQTSAVELGTLGMATNGETYSESRAINDSGTIVGLASKYASDGTFVATKAVRWHANTTAATELDGVTFRPELGPPDVQVSDVNNAGNAVGYEEASGFYSIAIRWDASGTTATELKGIGIFSPTSPGTYSKAYAINSQNSVVGSLRNYTSTNTNDAAGAWDASGTPIDLNTLMPSNSGWVRLTSATAISDVGWIAGIGTYDPDGSSGQDAYARAFLMLVPQLGTYGKGDANFDTKTDFADLVILAQKYNLANPTQKTDVADFDLNGVTDFQDLIALAQNYSSGAAIVDGIGGADFAADWALAQSLVPEPATWSVVTILGCAVARRTRR